MWFLFLASAFSPVSPVTAVFRVPAVLRKASPPHLQSSVWPSEAQTLVLVELFKVLHHPPSVCSQISVCVRRTQSYFPPRKNLLSSQVLTVESRNSEGFFHSDIFPKALLLGYLTPECL